MKQEYQESFCVSAEELQFSRRTIIKDAKTHCLQSIFATVALDFDTNDFNRLEIRWRWREETFGARHDGRRFILKLTAQTLSTD